MRGRRWAVVGTSVLSIVALGGLAYGQFVSKRNASSRAAVGDPRLVPTTSTPSRSANGVHAPWIVAENQRPGTDGWRLTPHRGRLEAYADTASAVVGDTVTLFASTDASTFHVESYRMGYYQGLGGRLVWRSAEVLGVKQAASTRDATTNLVEARWEPSLRMPIDGTWPPGDYLLKVVGDQGAQSYVPLTVRDDTSEAALVLVNGVATWQAYNRWGGYNLYQGPKALGDYTNRSRIVSFDRPYDGDGGGGFLGTEHPLVSLVEQLGLDVTYVTDVDLERHPDLVLHHRAILTGGHAEYWSTSMRRAAEDGVTAGVNLAFFGANAVFRHIRFAPSRLGPDRHVVDYKDGKEDPLRGKDNSELTVNWREPPLSKPEASLIGQQYECNPVKADMVVADASAWVFEGTGLRDGERLTGLVGPEYDRYQPKTGAPSNVQLLAHSPLRCGGRASFSDMTYYSAPSGAGVVATGTNWWIPKLPLCTAPPCDDAAAVMRITRNILEAFAVGPAGLVHPSVPNAKTLRVAPEPTTTSLSRRSHTGRTTTTQHGPSRTTRPDSSTTVPTQPAVPATEPPPVREEPPTTAPAG